MAATTLFRRGSISLAGRSVGRWRRDLASQRGVLRAPRGRCL